MLLLAITIVVFLLASFLIGILLSIRERSVPNGWFVHNMIVFNELDKRGFASRGFVLEPPDLRNTTVEARNDFHIRFSRFLSTFSHPETLQLQWSIDSDYREELLRFDRDTERLAANPWTRRVRKQRFHRAWRLMERGVLRREHLKMFITVPIQTNTPNRPDGPGLERQYRGALESLDAYFNSKLAMMQNIFGGDSFKIRPMDNAEHFRHYLEFLNPGIRKRTGYDPLPVFDPQRTIQENCLLGGIVGKRSGNPVPDFGFSLDGYCHDLLVFRRWPQNAYPGIFQRLTDINLHDYAITVNLRCRNVQDEIRREEKEIERLSGDYESEHRHSLLTSIGKKREKVDSLASGFAYPFTAEIIVRAWAETPLELNRKMTAIKTAVNLMGGAQYWECSRPATAVNLFLQSWPGWTMGRYDGYALYAENTYLSMLLPLSSTFTGHLASCEALYDGNAFNLVGIRNFLEGSPQHAAVFGMSGAGKSALLCDLLSQTECFYGFTVLIEEGLSYGMYTETMGAKPVILKPDGRITLNYLDTQKLPLSKGHLKAANALASKMCGSSSDEERRNIRTAQIGQYLDHLYTDVFQEWRRRNESTIPEIARHCAAVTGYLEEEMTADDDFLDAWAEFRDILDGVPPVHLDEAAANSATERALERLAGVTEEEITRIIVEDPFHHRLRDAAYAWIGPDECPTHSMLHEIMLDPLDEHDRGEIMHVASLLAAWTQEGPNGTLFDGPTRNIDLKGKIVHFELGRLTASDTLKSLAGFLINNYVRQHVMTLPRNIRKRYVFEEAGRLLDVPGGAEIVSECYAQMRKFNTWVVSIVQQYGMFRNSSIRPVVMGNSRQWFILKQNDRRDLEDINRDVGLPESTCESIMRYASPETLPANDRYSSLTYYHLDAVKPVCGTVRNYVSPEMLLVASTTGSDYDAKARILAKVPDKIEAIRELASKSAPNREAA
jgi:hypothetical protein